MFNMARVHCVWYKLRIFNIKRWFLSLPCLKNMQYDRLTMDFFNPATGQFLSYNTTDLWHCVPKYEQQKDLKRSKLKFL